MIKEKLPTAEEVLKTKFVDGEWDELMSYLNTDITKTILLAMMQYRSLHTAPLQARIEELKEELEKWKYDKKESGDKMFELKLEIKRLKSENEDLKSAIKDMRDELYKGNYDG